MGGMITQKGATKRLWIAGILGSTIITAFLSLYGLTIGISIVIPHIFYIPIVLTAYRYPRYGVAFSVGLSLIYMVPAAILTYPDMVMFLAALIRVIFFIAIAFIVSTLSGKLKQNSKELGRRNRQLSIINRIIGISTTSKSLDDLIQTFLSETPGLLAVDGGAIYLMKPEGKVQFKQAWGVSDAVVAAVQTIDITAPPVADVIEGKSVYNPVFALQGSSAEPVGVFSCAFIPLHSGKELVGILLLFREKDNAYSPDERKNLEAIGQKMGIAVEKALLQEKLEAKYEEANLYLDIMSHDINNANTASIGYATLLIGMLEGSEREFARKLLSSVQKSVEIIGNVSTIRRLHQESFHLQSIDLDHVIREEIQRFGETTINYDGYAGRVIADDLLREVFTNLIGNSVKFGSPDVEITIFVEEKDDLVEVGVADNGPGIADEDKPEIFNRFRRGQSKRSGKGLGLYISRMLVEGYGGKIWAEDRVFGRLGEGACIRFTLRRVTNT
jgi:signal transduction histidine kinase